MKIKLLAVGKTDANYIAEAVSIYEKRLKHYTSFEIIYLPDIKNTKNLNSKQQKEKEGTAILAQLADNDDMVLLDEAGKMYTSIEFSVYLSKKMLTSAKMLVFVIGGSCGFSQAVYNRAGARLSLSPMTFTHQMVRILFVEQLYRAFTIIKGESYHHI
ncbi:MAG: 23S rRNA (pseudouridine(1915)-N(3))-methyltransferase RlmH [Prevotellaceae bacterium]|jgi:23S rRNA (pseudouridine1915-N3)-methyltransferase|nr:23S rRNA (pseudouridine(1915)-N(3))-methyltransferase RlmH [Prevotellaceae bacterium]